MNLESVWSMLPDAYCVNFPCELKITSAISQSHRMLPERERERERERWASGGRRGKGVERARPGQETKRTSKTRELQTKHRE